MLIAALLVGFALRLYQLGAESLWYDETVSVYLAGLPPAQLIAHTAGDIHPPGYYLLLHLWNRLAHATLAHGLEFLPAWVSVSMGMVILALLTPISVHLFDRRVALVAVWLAAINPFHLWYSQEVRMYTLAAALGLLCLWATLRWFDHRLKKGGARWLGVYVLAAAAGLYTLYYFTFALIGLTFIALLLWLRQRRGFKGWLFAQFAVAALYLPWLSILWRQASDPPVPPWRVPWQSLGAAGAAIGESLSALVVGQNPPGQLWLLWVALAALVLLVYCALWVEYVRGARASASFPIPLIAVFAPLALIYLITWFVAPLYHVRYLFTYAPLFVVIAGVSVVGLARRKRAMGALLGVALVAVSMVGLREFWLSPLYRADDHRSAVARLAKNWRPDDAILVNAGWIHPILEVYWPREIGGGWSALPPDIARRIRLIDLAHGRVDPARQGAEPPPVTVVRSGSVDGDESLGWGDPASDFFAISAAETITGLNHLAHEYDRVWHYRLYDTVSDPEGVIRQWLDEHGRLVVDEAIPGRDFGRLQLFDLENPIEPGELRAEPLATFGDSLNLIGVSAPLTVAQEAMLYTHLLWEALPGLGEQPAPLSMSLRLYDADGALLAQSDAPPDLSTDQWTPGQRFGQTMALGVPTGATPGEHTLELVVYRQNDSSPLSLTEDPQTVFGQRRILQRVAVQARQ
jgi:hypothetical protein